MCLCVVCAGHVCVQCVRMFVCLSLHVCSTCVYVAVFHTSSDTHAHMQATHTLSHAITPCMSLCVMCCMCSVNGDPFASHIWSFSCDSTVCNSCTSHAHWCGSVLLPRQPSCTQWPTRSSCMTCSTFWGGRTSACWRGTRGTRQRRSSTLYCRRWEWGYSLELECKWKWG